MVAMLALFPSINPVEPRTTICIYHLQNRRSSNHPPPRTCYKQHVIDDMILTTFYKWQIPHVAPQRTRDPLASISFREDPCARQPCFCYTQYEKKLPPKLYRTVRRARTSSFTHGSAAVCHPTCATRRKRKRKIVFPRYIFCDRCRPQSSVARWFR